MSSKATATIEYCYLFRYRKNEGKVDRSKEYYGEEGAFDNDNFTSPMRESGVLIVPIEDLLKLIKKHS